MKSQNTTSSTYTDNNNLYQGLIQTKKIPIIRTLRPSKDYQTVIEQRPDPSQDAKKDNDIFLIPGNDEIVQHIIPVNKQGLQEILAL